MGPAASTRPLWSARIIRVIDFDRWQVPDLVLREVQSNYRADALHGSDWDGDPLLAP